MKTTAIKCSKCGVVVERPSKEIARRIRAGKLVFFCGRRCANQTINASRANHKIAKRCAYCGSEFTTTSGSKGASFCSRGCASSGSMTEHRRAEARRVGLLSSKRNASLSLKYISSALLAKESWKYSGLTRAAQEIGLSVGFEVPVGSFIFDMCVPDANTLIEFDGPDHSTRAQVNKDSAKDSFAKASGWRVVRVPVEANSLIDPANVMDALSQCCGGKIVV